MNITLQNAFKFDVQQDLELLGFWSLKKTCISKTVRHEVGKKPQKMAKILINPRKSAYLKYFGNQFKTVYVFARYAHLEAAYLKALLYITNYIIDNSIWIITHFRAPNSKHLTPFSIIS